MAYSEYILNADVIRNHTEKKFPLLRRLSISSLVAMLLTASAMVLFYRNDQMSEHEDIAAHENALILEHLVKRFDGQLNSFVTSSRNLDARALRTNPEVDALLPAIENQNDGRWLKLKLYDLYGRVIFSSARNEIAQDSKHPALIQRALLGEVVNQTEFRKSFHSSSAEMNNVYVSLTYMPLVHSGQRIGAIEIYSDVSPVIARIQQNTIRIALLIFGAFSVLYIALFFAALKTDRDVGEWQRLVNTCDRKMRDMAFYDALTQLPNRYLLEDRLIQSMAASKRNGHYCALMFLDLDNFKPLNDMYGHNVGDSLLAEGASRINDCVREIDTVARYGGDEFVVILGELDKDKAASERQAAIVAEKIRSALAAPYTLKALGANGEPIVIEHCCTSSIGVMVYFDHQETPAEILRYADAAMYQAKEA